MVVPQVTLGWIARNRGIGPGWTGSSTNIGMRLVLQTADWIRRGALEVITRCLDDTLSRHVHLDIGSQGPQGHSTIKTPTQPTRT